MRINLLGTSLLSARCSRCREVKPLDQFDRRRDASGATRAAAFCKPCRKAYVVERLARPGVEERSVRQRRDTYLQRRYGIDVERYDRMLRTQRGRCAVCGTSSPGVGGRKGDSPMSFAVDHDHATGRVRGLLCGDCNTGIGLLADDPRRLERAAEYLRAHQRYHPRAPRAPTPEAAIACPVRSSASLPT